MTTEAATPPFSPKLKWTKTIDEVLLQVRMNKLKVSEKKRLKEFEEEREHWRRHKRNEKLKKEKKYLEDRKERYSRRRGDTEDGGRRRTRLDESQDRVRFQKFRGENVLEEQLFKQRSRRRDMEEYGSKKNDGRRLRSIERSRTEGTSSKRSLRRMNSVDNFH